ncbi:Thymidylate kinase, putative [Leishmania lindenbergi]|uniref:Thymidylate kinase n=1 Tax=Leishmania lindenbergi TaxID=651832 RepID=A0AAW3AY80_9TRYP
MPSIAALSRTLHGGTSVYRSRLDSLKVLHAVAQSSPPWWTPSCSSFLRQAESLSTSTSAASGRRHPVIVVEGLDGTGKTLITRTLAEKLSGMAVSTPPPQFAEVRETFRSQEEVVARAFYSAANYIAAEGILAASQSAVVVVDRWWCSTCAMALANAHNYDSLPPSGDAVYRWPEDLPAPDAGFLLCVDEAVRVARIRKRAPEDFEEQRLSSQSEMRRVAMEAYRRTNMLTEVAAPTYRVAVNSILRLLPESGVVHCAAAFTQAELDSIEPF